MTEWSPELKGFIKKVINQHLGDEEFVVSISSKDVTDHDAHRIRWNKCPRCSQLHDILVDNFEVDKLEESGDKLRLFITQEIDRVCPP